MSGRSEPIPVTLIGGFLGAGKTTLLNHILSAKHGLRVAVLVNDFGAVNIDAGLVVGIDGDTISLANGCICCSMRDDLVGACLALLQRPERPDYLIVETSGVSDPVRIANTFLSPQLQQFLELDAILCVVDCEQFPELTGDSSLLAHSQVAAADITVLNKIDLIDSTGLAKVRALIAATSPGSRVLAAHRGQVPLELLLGTGLNATGDQSSNPSEHRPHRGLSTWHWTSERPLSLPKLRRAFERLPDDIYRAKGVVYLDELPQYRVVLQKVGARSSLRDAGRWGPQIPRTELVMIGLTEGMDTDALQTAFDGCIRHPDEEMSPMVRVQIQHTDPGPHSGEHADPNGGQ